MSTQGGGQKMAKFCPRSCWMPPTTLFCTLFSPSCYFGFLACFFAPTAPYFFLLYSAEWLLCYSLVCQYCSDPYQFPLSNGFGHNWRTSRYQNTQQYCTLFCKTGSLIEFTHNKKENIIVFQLVLFWSQKLTKGLDFAKNLNKDKIDLPDGTKIHSSSVKMGHWSSLPTTKKKTLLFFN